MSVASRISTGAYIVETPCPLCGQLTDIVARLSSEVVTDQFGGQKLKLKLKAEALDHNCNIHQLDITDVIEANKERFESEMSANGIDVTISTTKAARR